MCVYECVFTYGVASVSRINNIIGLFCKRALSKGRYSAKETCNLIDPADRSHPIDSCFVGLAHFLLCIFIEVYVAISVYIYIKVYMYKYGSIKIHMYVYVCVYTCACYSIQNSPNLTLLT